MSLKRIEIEGFKSFPNRTVINFDKGFTCIVGPNGCGKSNVSDAIRWVLGEKSAKQVRGNSMKDVIFSGADNKKEMGYAEVTLYFDNTDRRFKYSGDEFSITRKIFRSRSDNYYYINGKQQKLSEIVELFRDTGAGKDGFSIVGQGKISDIINFKDTDRRRIFDEAAGVAHIKQEKKKTMSKLKDVESNMSIKQASLDALSNYLQELEEQVEKAKMYTELTEELKSERLNYFVNIYDSSEETKRKYRLEIEEESEYIQKQQESLALINKHIAAYDEEIETINVEIERKHALKSKLSVDQANLSGELKLHNSNLQSARDTLQKIQKDVKSTNDNLVNLRKSLQDDEKSLEEQNKLKADYELESASLTAKVEVLTADLEAAENKIDYLNNARISGADQLGEFLSSKASAEREAVLLQENLKTAEEDLAKQQEEISKLDNTSIALDKEISDNNAQMTKANDTKKSFGNKKNDATTLRAQTARDLERLQVEVATKKIEVENLATRLKDEHGYNRVTNSVLQRAEKDVLFASNIVGAVGDMFTVSPEYQDAINAALGGAVNNIITEDAEKSKKVLEYVNTLHQGRLVCQPISEMSPEELGFEYRRFLQDPAVIGVAADLIEYDPICEPVYRKLLGRFVIVKDYDNAFRIWRESRRGFKIVTLTGEYFDVSGSISGGDNKSDTDVRYREAKKYYEALSQKFESERSKYEKLQLAEKDYDEKYNQYRGITDDLRMKAIELQAKRQNFEKEKENALNVLRSIVARKTSLSEKLLRAQQEIENAKNSQSKATDERVNIDDLIKAETVRKDQIKKDLDSVTQQSHNTDIEKQKCIEKISALTSAIARFKRDISDKEALLSALTVDEENINKKIQELIDNTPKMQRSEEQERQIQEIDDQIKKLGERRTALTVQRVEDDRQKEDFNKRILLSTEKKSSCETKLQSVDSELQEWESAIYEDYGFGYQEALLYKRDDFEKSKAKSQIAKLKAAITRLGDVNMGAEASYKERKGEFDELSIALNDLAAAKNDLEQLSARHSREIEEKFTKAFDAINANFQSTFGDLFGGGKAELYLTENENEEEDKGVDIDVTLPGKSRKPLSLLSGGEQTLTAIAILFAILKYKGSPFVILDEVESALDEVNCIKFAKYLKQFAKISRFIVITHKKPTMNEGDVLYGITMMEPGVSNVLTVTMEEAIKMAKEEE